MGSDLKHPPVTEERIEHCLSILARIIDSQGDAAWPLFERLEREVEGLGSRRARIERYIPRSNDG